MEWNREAFLLSGRYGIRDGVVDLDGILFSLVCRIYILCSRVLSLGNFRYARGIPNYILFIAEFMSLEAEN